MDKIKQQIAQTPTASHWETVGVKHHHGICMPLFSLHSLKSSGLGEFLDLKFMIDWCKDVGMDVLQLLPLNECHPYDPSPYNALSSCALDYIYISLHKLPYLEKDEEMQKLLNAFDKYKNYPEIAYVEIRKDKLFFLEKYFHKYFSFFEKEEAFHTFAKQNEWIKEYAAYKILKNLNTLKPWPEWTINTEKNLLLHKNKSKLEFYTLLQYLAYGQMMEVKKYASCQGVFLKGDIPIAVSPDSADVYFNQEFFDLDYVMGIPPDDISPFGDKWGFYMFNWKKMKESNFFWWQRRLSLTANIYHMYRVDHAAGFFRLWAIPYHETSDHGFFLPKDPSLWENLGREHFKMLINASPLLPLAEDLGLIPPFVYTVLKELGISGTKILRWQKKDPKKFDPISITTVSTHDTETLHQWWQNKENEAAEFAALWGMPYEAEFTKKLRKLMLIQAHHSASLFHINLLPEYLAFFDELIHDNPEKERINHAGSMSKTNWSYRLVQPVEKVTAHAGLKEMIKEILKPKNTLS